MALGRAKRGHRILILMAEFDVRVIDVNGIVLRQFTCDLSIDYQPRRLDIVSRFAFPRK
jgi:hypothetical protein